MRSAGRDGIRMRKLLYSLKPYGSDHESFLNRGMPAILLIDNDGDAEAYPCYHKAQLDRSAIIPLRPAKWVCVEHVKVATVSLCPSKPISKRCSQQRHLNSVPWNFFGACPLCTSSRPGNGMAADFVQF